MRRKTTDLRTVGFKYRCLKGKENMWGEKIFYEVFRQKLIDKKDVYEINFYIEGDKQYDDCWMGYSDDGEKDSYWFGLPDVDCRSYVYATADEILNAKVFSGRSMHELWDKVCFSMINGLGAIDWAAYNCFGYYYCRKQDACDVAKLAVKKQGGEYEALSKKLEAIVETDGNIIYTAYFKEKMVAFAYCSVENDFPGYTDGPVGRIKAIYVEEEYRVHGIASYLIRCCENWAGSKGCKYIAADCGKDDENTGITKLCLFNGFKKMEEAPYCINDLSGNGERRYQR